MITKESIEERKKVLLNDIQTVKSRLAEYEQKKTEDTALANALTGALQQCDVFLKEYDDEPDLVSDSGDVDE
jgi:predicted ribosome quality control (RQC) complex YloA/Tae2 family protein|tara:strand:- start:973 stop:1188 length:216 start_codon:yes stop_codon:yes gene_type:complete